MTKYIIRELENPNSIRQGEVVEASSLTVAKRMATRMQVFQGTYMLIELANDDGSRTGSESHEHAMSNGVPDAARPHGAARLLPSAPQPSPSPVQ